MEDIGTPVAEHRRAVAGRMLAQAPDPLQAGHKPAEPQLKSRTACFAAVISYAISNLSKFGKIYAASCQQYSILAQASIFIEARVGSE